MLGAVWLAFDIGTFDLDSASSYRIDRELQVYAKATAKVAQEELLHTSCATDKSRVFGKGFTLTAFAGPSGVAWWASPQVSY